LQVFTTFSLKVVAGLCAFIISVPAYSQVRGCKDPLANNYNSSATVNDGSCTYNATSYTPPVKTNPISSTLSESSGLQMADNFLWSFNDGGGEAAIYRIDTLTNAILQTVNLADATNVDWEDIGFDGTYFYLGDFGNNASGARTDLKIYKFPLSAIPAYETNPVVTIPANQIQVINFTYSDQEQPPVPGISNSTKFDCEAMIVDKGSVHLFTKNWIDVNTTHYVINSLLPGSYTATPVDTLETGFLVTGADKATDRETIALLGYQATGLGRHFMHLLTDYSAGKYFNGNKRKIDLPNALTMGQAEGVTFRNGTYGYISNETFLGLVPARLRYFDISTFVSNSAGEVLPVGFSSVKAWSKNNSVQVEWSVAAEENIEKYIVERSANGQEFTDAATVASTKNNNQSATYQWLDVNPAEGNNFYRIKAVEKTGNVKLSSVIHVKTGSSKSGISVFPNPVKGRSIMLELANQKQGNYTVQLYNNSGTQLSIFTIKHPGGSAIQAIPLNDAIVKGIYQLKINNGDNKTMRQIVVN